MRIEDRIRKLKPALDYLGEYDKLMAKPDGRKALSITLSNKVLDRLKSVQNRSRFIEAAIEKSLSG